MKSSRPRTVISLLCTLALALAFAFAAQAQTLGATLSKQFIGGTATPGGSVTLEFTIKNTDTAYPVHSITFTDDLDAMLSGTTATGPPESDICGAGSELTGTSVLTLTGGTLAAGGSCTFSVTVQVPANAALKDYLNTTSYIAWESDIPSLNSPYTGGPASATLTVGAPVTWSKSFTPTSVTVGQPSTLAFTIDNTASSVAASSIAFTDPLPTGMKVANPAGASSTCGATFAPSPGDTTLTFSGGSVAAGATCTISAKVVATASGKLANTTKSLSASTGSAAPVNATLTVVTTLQIPTLNVWALVALASLLLLSAGWFLRR